MTGGAPEALWGRIAAGLSHDMNNVLATTAEATGLMQDIMRTVPAEAFTHRDKMDRALASVQKAVGRGVDLTKHLSRWAHTTDSERTEIDPEETVRLVVFLLGRQARQKRVELTAAEGRRLPRLKASPAGLVLVLAALVEHALAAAPEGGRVTLGPVKDGRRLAFEVTVQGAASPSDQAGLPGDLAAWLASQGAEVSPLGGRGEAGWRLLFEGD